MSKCRRCDSTILTVTGETCALCGEPIYYATYYPHAGEIKVAKAPTRHSAYQQSDILSKIQRFCTKYSFPETVFGRRFMQDANLVIRLKNGAVPRPETVRRIERAMLEYSAG